MCLIFSLLAMSGRPIILAKQMGIFRANSKSLWEVIVQVGKLPILQVEDITARHLILFREYTFGTTLGMTTSAVMLCDWP